MTTDKITYTFHKRDYPTAQSFYDKLYFLGYDGVYSHVWEHLIAYGSVSIVLEAENVL